MSWDAGFLIGLTGTLLSAAGFFFTFQQLRKTANATTAVNAAIDSLRHRISSYDHISECTLARKSLEHSISLIKLREWPVAVISLSEAQSSLHRVSSSQACSNTNQTTFSNLSSSLIDSISEIEEMTSKNIDPSLSEIMKDMRKCINLLDTESSSKAREF